MEVALHRETTDAEALKLGERGVPPLVAVLAERREAVAKSCTSSPSNSASVT
jgi:hypothetical protein